MITTPTTDVCVEHPDKKSILLYLITCHSTLHNNASPTTNSKEALKLEAPLNEMVEWLKEARSRFEAGCVNVEEEDDVAVIKHRFQQHEVGSCSFN